MDVLNIGGMNVNGQQEAIGVGDDVALAAIDTLAGVEAARPAGLRRRSALAVDDGGRRLGLASEFAPRLPDQSADDPVPAAGVAPSIEIALDRRVRRELAWQSAPLAAGRQNVQNRLDNLAQIDFPRPSQSAPRRQPPGDQRPLRIGHVACIAQSVALILQRE